MRGRKGGLWTCHMSREETMVHSCVEKPTYPVACRVKNREQSPVRASTDRERQRKRRVGRWRRG